MINLARLPWGVEAKTYGDSEWGFFVQKKKATKLRNKRNSRFTTFAIISQLKNSHKCKHRKAKGRREPRVWREVWSELPENVHVVRGRGRVESNIQSAMLRRAEGEGFERRFSTWTTRCNVPKISQGRSENGRLSLVFKPKSPSQSTAAGLDVRARSWFETRSEWASRAIKHAVVMHGTVRHRNGGNFAGESHHLAPKT